MRLSSRSNYGERPPAGAAPEPVVVFLHIPKTGGSSLANMLAARFAPDQIYRRPNPGHLPRLTGVDPRCRFIHGHLDWSDLEVVGRAPIVVTMLRRPAARVLSLYWFWRSFTWAYAERTKDFGVWYAKSVGPEEFFTNAPPEIRANYENAMVRQLVGADFCAPGVGFTIPDDEAVGLAKRRTAQIDVCGLTERFAFSAALIAPTLGMARLPARRDNSLAGRKGGADYDPVRPTRPSAYLMERLREVTALDEAVYRHVWDRYQSVWERYSARSQANAEQPQWRH
jgi:hypothetical protein